MEASRKPRVYVWDDAGASSMLSRCAAELEIVGRASGPAPSLPELARAQPDVIVIFEGPQPSLAWIGATRRHRSLREAGLVVVLPKEDVERALDIFQAGADDCIASSCDPRLLAARLKALAARRLKLEGSAEPVIKKGLLSLDCGRCELRIGAHKAALTRTELELLKALLARPGWVVRREALRSKLPGTDQTLSHSLDNHMSNLRRKLGPHGSRLRVAKGIGYVVDL